MLKLHSAGSKGKTLGLFLLELFFAEAKKSGNAYGKRNITPYREKLAFNLFERDCFFRDKAQGAGHIFYMSKPMQRCIGKSRPLKSFVSAAALFILESA